MKKQYLWLIPCLLFSLFIYLFYRTEKTVVNEIFIWVFSANRYFQWRTFVTHAISLPEHVVYSLPEALWVFCITLTSKQLYVKAGSSQIQLIVAPLLFAVGLELFQLFHFTNGRFDFWDIGLSVLFWAIALYGIRDKGDKQNILAPFNSRSLVCALSYLIVYLAHVWT